MASAQGARIISFKSCAYFLVGIFAPLFDVPGIKLFNRPIRLILIYVFVPVLQEFLRSKYRLNRSFRLICRHSVNDPNNYNFLYSDIDLNMVIDASQLETSFKLQQHIQKLRRLFIFLGELEIYTPQELQEAKAIVSRLGEHLVFIRNLRKIGWIEDDLQIFKTSYHLKKAKRSLAKILSKVGGAPAPKSFNNVKSMDFAIQSFLTRLTDVQPTETSFKIFVNYLGFTVAQGAENLSSSERGVKLPGAHGLLLLAILPYSGDSNLQAPLSILRQNRIVYALHRDFLDLEICTLSAVYRGNPLKFPWMLVWINDLRAMREAKHHPIDITI